MMFIEGLKGFHVYSYHKYMYNIYMMHTHSVWFWTSILIIPLAALFCWFFHARIAFVTEKCENINPEEDDIIDELDEGQIRYGFILLPLRD